MNFTVIYTVVVVVVVVPFLASSVPDLGLDEFGVDGNSSSLEFDPNGGFGVKAELILSKP